MRSFLETIFAGSVLSIVEAGILERQDKGWS